MIHTLSQTTKQIIFLAVIIFGLLAYSFMNASWTPPPATPPNENTLPPINVGTTSIPIQAGVGALQFDILSARDTVSANVEMRSPSYCNADGTKCMTIGNTNPISGDGGNEMVYLPAPVEIVPMYNQINYINAGKLTDFSLKDHGYPDNIVRVFITSYGGGSRGTCEMELNYTLDFSYPFHNIVRFNCERLSRDGIFIPVANDGVLHFHQKIMSGAALGLNVEISGYECAGKCHSATTKSCEVEFSWWAINDHSNTGSVTKIIYGTTPMAVGINLARGGALTGSVPYSEILGQYSWGGGTFYHGHHAIIGFYEPIRYFGQTAAVYTHGNLFVGSLNMSPNSTVTVTAMGSLVNVTGDASVTATVLSCTS